MTGADLETQDTLENQVIWAEGKLKEINEELTVLQNDAEDVVSEYWFFRCDNNAQNKKRKNQSIMGVRVRLREGKYLAIEWFWNTFYRRVSDGKWRVKSHYIRRKKGSLSYNRDILLKKAQGWEVEKILQTEQRLISFRERYHVLARQRAEVYKIRKKASEKLSKLEENL